MKQYSTNIPSILNTESGPVSVKDFSYFLYHFRAVYVESLKLAKKYKVESFQSKEKLDEFQRVVEVKLANLHPMSLSKSALYPLDESEDLFFTELNRRNPIEIVFECIGVALTIAVIISGGKIKFTKEGVEAELPPLGEGIDKLRMAINKKHRLDNTNEQEFNDDNGMEP